MPSILFVCLGNICRSPLAEAVLRGEARRRGEIWSSTSQAWATAVEANRWLIGPWRPAPMHQYVSDR
uniref:Phosphotyrosine protein phosphatase I domain-containing protein n=1 Tax=Agrobacterium albertimagni TaxID=147266 RepID=A0A7C1T4L9_9HYPH